MCGNIHKTQSIYKGHIGPKVILSTISTLFLGFQGCSQGTWCFYSKDSKDASSIAYASSNQEKASNNGISPLKDDGSHFLGVIGYCKRDHHLGLIQINPANQYSKSKSQKMGLLFYAPKCLKDCAESDSTSSGTGYQDSETMYSVAIREVVASNPVEGGQEEVVVRSKASDMMLQTEDSLYNNHSFDDERSGVDGDNNDQKADYWEDSYIYDFSGSLCNNRGDTSDINPDTSNIGSGILGQDAPEVVVRSKASDMMLQTEDSLYNNHSFDNERSGVDGDNNDQKADYWEDSYIYDFSGSLCNNRGGTSDINLDTSNIGSGILDQDAPEKDSFGDSDINIYSGHQKDDTDDNDQEEEVAHNSNLIKQRCNNHAKDYYNISALSSEAHRTGSYTETKIGKELFSYLFLLHKKIYLVKSCEKI